MSIKWMGAILIVLGCGGVGFSIAANYKREMRALNALVGALEYIHSELTYRLTPLPDLFYKASLVTGEGIGSLFRELASEMEQQISPDAACCMEVLLRRRRDIPEQARLALKEMGKSLGNFDLEGQVRELSAVHQRCTRQLEKLSEQKEDRIRQYQTLGICAGAVLAILLI